MSWGERQRVDSLVRPREVTPLGPLEAERLIALSAAFIGTVSLWWCYFHRAERLGIDAAAVGDELAIDHPDLDVTASAMALIFGGPAIFLLAQLVFMRGVSGQAPRARIGGCVALAILALLTSSLSLLVAVIAAGTVLLAVAIGDTRAEPGATG